MATLGVRRFNLPVHQLPRGLDGFRIAHVSDLHLRRWDKTVKALHDRLCEHDFDLLLVTGDFCHDPRRHAEAAQLTDRLLGPIRPPLGTYGVLGNHDDPAFASHDLPLTILRDQVRLISVGAFEFYLAGIEQSAQRRGTYQPCAGGFDPDVPMMVMAHYPSTAFELPAGGGRIMFAGHTHGGQIRLPGIGCFYTNDNLPRSLARGLHAVRGNWLHVSAGIGVSGPIGARFFCPPELTLLTLRGRRRLRKRTSSARGSSKSHRRRDRRRRSKINV